MTPCAQTQTLFIEPPDLTDSFLLDSLRTFAPTSKSLRQSDFNTWPPRPCAASTIARRFGGWRSALERAGLHPPAPPTPEHLIDNLRSLWISLGRAPTSRDLSERTPLSPGAYARRWGTFRRAVTPLAQHENGGRLISTGGNAIWDLITYSTDLTKGTFRDNAGNRQEFHRSGYPPSQVLGTSYNENGWGSFAPFRVRNAGHWALAGTGLDDGDTFGEAGLSGPASGWEFDVLFGNEGEPKPEHIIAVGTNPVPGGGAVMSVTPRGTNGGWVFAASSLTFNGSLPEDEVCSRILHNVFDRALSAGPNGQRYSGPISPRPNVTQVSPPAVASHIPDVPSSDEREGGLRHRWIT